MAPLHADESVHDVILGLLDADSALDPAVKDVVLEALAEVSGRVEESESVSPATILTSIEVSGFRGIGPTSRLALYPAPGLTVISGRNGSGKSSFAEALEMALTGTSYRWLKKEALWAEAWHNLHHDGPCQIRVGFVQEGGGQLTVGLDWAEGDALSDCDSWTRHGKGKRSKGIDGLGWARPLELCRPVLSYDELGRLFDGGPSALYDALAKLLGLDALTDAEKSLAATLKAAKADRAAADDERKRLAAQLCASSDERAVRAVALLRRKPVPLDDVRALATGSDDDLQVVPALRALAELEVPSIDEIGSAATRLRTAAEHARGVTTALVESTNDRIDLLAAALHFHDRVGDVECPVCGQGGLDAQWAVRARDTVAITEAAVAEYRAATIELKIARGTANGLVTGLRGAAPVADVDLPTMAAYNDGVTAATALPSGDEDVASHLESVLVEVVGAAEALRSEAESALAQRESTWAPLAAALGGWVVLEEQARPLDATIKATAAAKKWVTEHVGAFRNLRLQPIAAQARHIWGRLRQESNVDLGEITLEGTATRRKAVLGGSVDGKPTKALAVMSQGELHALALALFLPRATRAASPFRFVVLDDPIQAMDPAKIDGFVDVLSEIAQTHQVIVFSHDDRLASVIREAGVDAGLVEVVREAGSQVSVRDNVSPAVRYVGDAVALLSDDRLPDEVKRRAVPGLFRLALESAARQAFYTRQSLAGVSRPDAELAWQNAKRTNAKVALAVLGDPKADLSAWRDAKPARRRALGIGNAGAHGTAGPVDRADARDLKSTVEDLLALR